MNDLGRSFPIGALISVATSLLDPALLKTILKKEKKMRRKDNHVMKEPQRKLSHTQTSNST